MAANLKTSTYVYVSNAESNDIYVFHFNPKSGELTMIEKVAIPSVTKSGMSTPLAVSPDKKFLFVATRGEPQAVHTFAIQSDTGKLKLVGSGPLPDSMPFISTDRSGRFLFAASYPGHKLTVSAINTQGIAQPAHQILDKQTNAHSILPDKQNRFVLAMTLGNDLLNVFKFDEKTGKLEAHNATAVKAKTGPRHFVFHPNGRLVYLLGELDATIHVFDWDAANGVLKEKQAVSALLPGTTGRIAAADLHLTPNGKFLYASERTSNALAGFKINTQDGTLTLIEHVQTEAQPRAFSIDSSGRYLLVAGQRSHQLATLSIDGKTGKLSKLHTTATGLNPTWIEIIDFQTR